MDVQRNEVEAVTVRVRIGGIEERDRVAAAGERDSDALRRRRMRTERSRQRVAEPSDAGSAPAAVSRW